MHTDADLRDETRLMGHTAGWLWLLAGLVGLVGPFLPGATDDHRVWVAALAGLVVLYGVASIRDWIDWLRFPLGRHAVASAIGLVVTGVAMWLTGGARTFVEPLLVMPLLYIAYFFPPRLGWPLALELVAVGVSPLLYDEGAVAEGYAARALAMAVGFCAVTLVMQRLKRRLVDGEARQREMAERDALTGIANRRAFDRRLRDEIARCGDQARGRRAADPDGFALLFLDIDGFKAINDRFGHPAGDGALQRLAQRWWAAVRPGDLLARIGGDEFALIAPGAGDAGSRRLAIALADEAHALEAVPGTPGIGVTITWALYPEDGVDAAALMRAADRRLHASKRGRADHGAAKESNLPSGGLPRRVRL